MKSSGQKKTRFSSWEGVLITENDDDINHSQYPGPLPNPQWIISQQSSNAESG